MLTDSDDYSKATLTYTGFKYEHPRFNVDGASVDRVAQGSGDEVILVGDSIKEIYYLGVTNGSLDPAKHVYSKVNLAPIVAAIFSSGAGATPKNLFPFLSVALMGEWIYLVQSSTAGGPVNAAIGYPMNHKHFFRVRLADVQATINVTPVKQNVSFVNADGQQFTNSSFYRWYEQVFASNGQVTKCLFSFNMPTNGVIGSYRSTPIWVAEDPARKGIYAMKFLSGFYVAQIQNGINQRFNYVPEINYDFDPTTGVMTLKSKSIIPPMINWGTPNFFDPAYTLNIGPLYGMVFTYAGQGTNVLADGRIIASGAQGFSGFPRLAIQCQVVDAKTKYASTSKFFGFAFNELTNYGVFSEVIVSPLESSINVRAMQYRPGGEFYIAAGKSVLTQLNLYWKDVVGKFALRPEVTNLIIDNVVSRPLTQSIRKVDCMPGIGGATVGVPSSQLDTYGIDVAESMFCMSSQKKYYEYTAMGTGWTLPLVGANDILLISDFTRRVEANGLVTIVPTKEIVYPAAIVELLKNQVQYPAIKNTARDCIVTVTDPTFSSLERFGWLPVTAVITYVSAEGSADRNDMYSTVCTIVPTYTDGADGRKQVTGFTVLDKYHYVAVGGAIDQIRIYSGRDSGRETPQSTLGPMRTYYYVNGNALTVHVNSGVIGNTSGDAYTTNHNFAYSNRNTRRWTSASHQDNSSAGGSVFITPDNGIATMYGWSDTTGGAASIVNGNVNKPLVGSVYPQVGWAIFFKSDIRATFNGKTYTLPAGVVDLRDIDAAPGNKVFYIYALLRNDVPIYEITQEKRLENAYNVWVGKVTTNLTQILTIERFNVFTINGSRISEIKRGNSIPASSGLVNAEGQIPWLRSDEMLP